MGFLIGFPIFIVGPCVIAAWVGSRIRSPLIAFVVTWVLTPFVAGLVAALGIPILREITPVGNDGTIVFMLPLIGVVTGLVAGIVAVVVVNRRIASEESQRQSGSTQSGLD